MTDVIGRPLAEAKEMLEAAGVEYNIEYSRPDRCFFTVDEGNAYVIRQREENGCMMLIIADKLRKEVS